MYNLHKNNFYVYIVYPVWIPHSIYRKGRDTDITHTAYV